MRKWRPLRYRGGRCYVLVGRRWRIVIRKRRRWYISYKRHLRPLRRNFGTFKIYLAKRFRPLKRIGKKYYVKIGRKVRLMNHRYKLFFNYKGRRVTVRRKGRRARVLWRGKWRRSRRIRYRRPKIRGEEKISSSVVHSSYKPRFLSPYCKMWTEFFPFGNPFIRAQPWSPLQLSWRDLKNDLKRLLTNHSATEPSTVLRWTPHWETTRFDLLTPKSD